MEVYQTLQEYSNHFSISNIFYGPLAHLGLLSIHYLVVRTSTEQMIVQFVPKLVERIYGRRSIQSMAKHKG